MTRQLIDAAGLYAAVPYHYAAVAPSGATVFTAGACPLDERGDVVGGVDIAVQTRQALTNLRAALAAAGCAIDDVLKTVVFVASSSHGDLVEAWQEVEIVFGRNGPPSTLVGVAALGWPGQLVEIEAIAARS